MSFEWKCIICEQTIPLDNNGDDSNGCLPNLEGGTININFGWPSKFDMLPHHMYQKEVRIQSSICDTCFEKKQHLTRMIEVINKKEFKTILDKNNESK